MTRKRNHESRTHVSEPSQSLLPAALPRPSSPDALATASSALLWKPVPPLWEHCRRWWAEHQVDDGIGALQLQGWELVAVVPAGTRMLDGPRGNAAYLGTWFFFKRQVDSKVYKEAENG